MRWPMISLRDHLPTARGSEAIASEIARSFGSTLSIVFLRSCATPSTRFDIGDYSAYMSVGAGWRDRIPRRRPAGLAAPADAGDRAPAAGPPTSTRARSSYTAAR